MESVVVRLESGRSKRRTLIVLLVRAVVPRTLLFLNGSDTKMSLRVSQLEEFRISEEKGRDHQDYVVGAFLPTTLGI